MHKNHLGNEQVIETIDHFPLNRNVLGYYSSNQQEYFKEEVDYYLNTFEKRSTTNR